MLRGPKGEKRPADVIGNAVHVMRKMVDASLPTPGPRGPYKKQAAEISN
jgi:hypothetical protein